MKLFWVFCWFLLALLILAGCATRALGPPIATHERIVTPAMLKAEQKTTQVLSVKSAAVAIIDLACTDAVFNRAATEAYYGERLNRMFSVEQALDMEDFWIFCSLPKKDRDDAGYGHIWGRMLDNLVAGILPYLGRDVVEGLRGLGLII